MFLDLALRRNPKLIETAFNLHQGGLIQPDTYILDLDAIIYNAQCIKTEADKYGIKLYFMTKQFGRNPYISRELMKLNYDGAVAVDFREAEVLYKDNIKLGNVGHLVQIPSRMISGILEKKPEIITVYSVEKAREISEAAKKLNINQNIMLKVIDKDDTIYPGQNGGFCINELIPKMQELFQIPNITISGVTSFPCFIVDNDTKSIVETNNLRTVMKAKQHMEEYFSIKLDQINTPSVTCTSNMMRISNSGGTHGEPGHGLLGTTPLHALKDQVEIPAIIYVSEISHNLGEKSYCYGGGYYRRSSMENAVVGKDIDTMKKVGVEAPNDSNIDYYFSIQENANVGDTAVFSFRTQIFVTRSQVAVIKGISAGKPVIIGIYDSSGKQLKGGA